MFALVVLLVSVFNAGEAVWILDWSDEFIGTTLNTGEWTFQTGGDGWGNNELEFYTNRSQNVRVENGHLVINAKVENYENRQFTSARLNSKRSWTYGKFEARAKMPKGKHLWPAIWMLSRNNDYGTWAASGEIDICEYRGDRSNEVLGTIHYGGQWPNNIYSGSGEKPFGIDFSLDYHTFGVEWNQTTILWKVDGGLLHSENIDRNMWSQRGTTNPYDHNRAPFDKPFYWILNLAVSGAFFPANVYGNPVTPAEAQLWAKPTLEIDYIRVYKWV